MPEADADGGPPRARAQAAESTGAPTPTPLGARELEILRAAAGGATNGQIAERLGLSEQTVKNYVGAAMRKLGVRDRTAAVVVALGRGVLDLVSVEILERRPGTGPAGPGGPGAEHHTRRKVA